MDPTVVLCVAMLILPGVSCHLIPDPLTSVDHHKRQTPDELQQCITAKFNFAFRGNSSQFVSDCRVAAEQAIILDLPDVFSLRSKIYTTFPTLCIPECRDVVLDAYDECGYYDISPFPGVEKFTTSICGTNENGDKCYRHYNSSITLFIAKTQTK